MIDWEACLKVNNQSQELVKELISMFRAELPNSVRALTEACYQQNYTEITREAHRLQGACGYAGALQLQSLLRNIEQYALNKQAAEITQTLESILDEVTKVQYSLDNPPF